MIESTAASFKGIAATAIACCRYCKKHGEYPKTLNALVPDFLSAIPIDIKDRNNEPLKLHYTDKELFIYSIGNDQTDSTVGGPVEGESVDDPVMRLAR